VRLVLLIVNLLDLIAFDGVIGETHPDSAQVLQDLLLILLLLDLILAIKINLKKLQLFLEQFLIINNFLGDIRKLLRIWMRLPLLPVKADILFLRLVPLEPLGVLGEVVVQLKHVDKGFVHVTDLQVAFVLYGV
jgi:hypothetical protein